VVTRLALEPPLDPFAYDYRHELRVRFAETDAMGVAHHASYLLYLEEARVAWMRDLDHPYSKLRDEGIDFATLEAFVQYRAPARFDDVITVHVGIGAVSRATFQVGYLLSVGPAPVATAVTVHGCVQVDGRPARMPGWVKELATGNAGLPGTAVRGRR
jgi:acyl-CoA thioester hydrolase